MMEVSFMLDARIIDLADIFGPLATSWRTVDTLEIPDRFLNWMHFFVLGQLARELNFR